EVLPPSAMAMVCLELEALTLRLLSEERRARDTAEQLEREAAVLTQTAGPEADRPILPTPSAVGTEEGVPRFSVSSSSSPPPSEELSDTDRASPPSEPSDTSTQRERRRTSISALLSTTLTAMVGGLVVVLAMELLRPRLPEPEPAPWLATPEEVAQFATDGGVAEEALSSVEKVPGAGVPYDSLGRPMPKHPSPAQRKPPCERGETAINGGCWVEVGREKPPCGEKMFEHEGYCYKPSVDMPRTPTAGEP
ncbi:MAG TPA: hypothetical protein VD972_43465, partial [Hyalangium sp.]|nr:hypothetical protein [Hyalangium sp.]